MPSVRRLSCYRTKKVTSHHHHLTAHSPHMSQSRDRRLLFPPRGRRSQSRKANRSAVVTASRGLARRTPQPQNVRTFSEKCNATDLHTEIHCFSITKKKFHFIRLVRVRLKEDGRRYQKCVATVQPKAVRGGSHTMYFKSCNTY
jgi:hypothetical protein